MLGVHDRNLDQRRRDVRRLQAEGLIEEDATFHGLRHTVGTNARDDGASHFRVAAALGDRSTARAQIYGRDAERKSAQASVLETVQKRFGNATLETKMETAPGHPALQIQSL